MADSFACCVLKSTSSEEIFTFCLAAVRMNQRGTPAELRDNERKIIQRRRAFVVSGERAVIHPAVQHTQSFSVACWVAAALHDS